MFNYTLTRVYQRIFGISAVIFVYLIARRATTRANVKACDFQ